VSDGDARNVYALIFLLLGLPALLVYLDWRRQGEIEYLHERVERMADTPVARILRAPNDEAAERAAREGL